MLSEPLGFTGQRPLVGSTTHSNLRPATEDCQISPQAIQDTHHGEHLKLAQIFLFLFYHFETGFHHVAQAARKLMGDPPASASQVQG